MLQCKVDSLPVEDSVTATAEAWQPSVDDDDNDESPSEPLTVTLSTTDPGHSFSSSYLLCNFSTFAVRV